jgi:hypothetical protein
MRTVAGFVSLRQPQLFAAFRAAAARSQRAAFRITDFTIEPTHGHFIVEAADARALANGARALAIRLTLAVRRVVGHRGPVWADRYHAHELRSPREYRNALAYVLNNWKKHVRAVGDMDAYSSAPWCSAWSELAKQVNDGWAGAQPGVVEPWIARGPQVPVGLSAREADTTPLCPVVPSGTWLGTVGWRERSGPGPIELGECPVSADWMRIMERAARRAAREARRAQIGARAAGGVY